MRKIQIPIQSLRLRSGQAFVLCTFCLLFAFRGEVRAGDLIYGDAELDVTIDAVDMLKISQNAAGYPEVPLLGNADASGHECALAVVDALAIRHYLLGFRPDLPVFNPPACWAVGLTATDGDGQVGVPNQTLPQPLEVTLNNIPACTQTLSGCTLGGVTITYDIIGDGTGGAVLSGGVTSLDIDTDSSGKVSTLLMLGPGPGAVTVVVSVDLYSAKGSLLKTVSATFTASAIGCGISSIGPTTGCPGDSVTISGSGFGPNTGTVSFNGTTAAITSWGDTSIVVEAPGGDYTTMTVTPSVTNECSQTGIYSYDDQAPTGLAASPAGGSYCPTTVSLSASDGTIYYTTDGSGPTTGSPVYAGPIDISGDTTLKFIAVDTCGNQSGTVTEIYDIDTEPPTGLTAAPAGGNYCTTPVMVSLGASDGTIYYTTDGSEPTTASLVYTVPINISTDTTLKFMAVDTCGYQSGTVTEVYTIDTTSPGSLAALPAGGSYCPTSVSLSCDDPGAAIYYTTDGSGPTTVSPVYAGPIDISGDTTLKFMAVDACGNQSGTVTELYVIDDEAGVTITEPLDGATIGTDADNVRVTGTASSDIASVSLSANQGTWTDANPVVSGGVWSSTLQGLVAGSILTITATGADDCGNIGSDSVTARVLPFVWFVDDTAKGNNDGSSWEDAFTTVQAAVVAAASGDWIWVAKGTYTNSPASTASVLTMKDGVEIYGGFEATEALLSERGDPASHPTVLDGEDTSHHVVVGASKARLDGFYVTGGNAKGGGNDDNGGGIYNDSVTNLMVANCTFKSNSAINDGGGMYNYNSSPEIINCTFSGNSANYGGGIFNDDSSSPTITNCTFGKNSANFDGGGMHNYDNSSPIIIDCTFSGNSAANGGGMFNAGSLTINNCIFISNLASNDGGGMYNYNSSPLIINCTFSGKNSADSEGGGMFNELSSPKMTNCIMWNDIPDEIYDDSSSPTVAYSDIQGGYPGTGNIDADPLFVPGPYANYYLSQTAAGQGIDSPCVDTGSDTAEKIGLDDRTTRTDSVPDSGIVDMGYHHQLDTMPPDDLTASPPGGIYCPPGVSVTLSCDDPGAAIYYTLDGSGPTTASPVYAGPIDISADTTLKFMAVDVFGNQSDTVTEVYDIDTEAPTGLAANPAGESYCATTVTLSAIGASTIYYTLDSSGPTTASLVYTGPIDVSVDTTVKFMAVDTCGNQAGTVTEVYDIYTDVPTGLAATPAGESYCPTMVSLSASDGTIYYTIDGTEPTTTSPAYTDPIDISEDTTLKFMAVEDICGNQSDTVTEVYDIDTTSPGSLAASPPGGAVCLNTSVTLSCDDPGATIYYTLDGSRPYPPESNVYNGPIYISEYTVLKFMAVDVCGNQSGTVTEIYDIDTEAPTGLAASPAGGSYCPTSVFLSASDGTIYYTTDGSGPTTASPVYTTPIDISMDTTLKFMAVDVCGNKSGTVTEVYDIDTEAVVSITSPADGATVFAGDIWVSGTADTDIATVTVTSDQGHSESSGVNPGGNWSVILTGVTLPSLTINASVTDNCGNIGSDSVTIFVYSEPAIWYVNDDATGAGTGLSWTDAYTTVQAAEAASSSGDWIWVAEGTYTNSPASTASVLTMKDGVEIYGGFTGTETDLSDRVIPNDHPTVLDGENMSYHVVVGASNARLDGFVVTGGNADGGGVDDNGGGIYNDSATNLMVANCTFSNNSANWAGGGIYNYESSPIITNCIFSGNSAYYGGGISNEDSSLPAINNSTFIGNSAIDGGGGLDNWNSSPDIINCTFSGNLANYGGGMNNENNSSPAITNCILWGDSAPTGPEIYTDISSTPIVTYSDIEGGYAGTGNIDFDPLFVGYPDLRLQRESRCIDTGTADGAPSDDLNGNPRPILDGYDMGAYERNPVPNWFVNDDAAGAGTGLSWVDAFTNVQEAVDAVSDYEVIFVAGGTYTNAPTSTIPVLTIWRCSFDIFGGFSGTESALSERSDPADHPTILDGENTSYHVVFIDGAAPRLDGFIVTGGNANGSNPDDCGGGIYITAATPMIKPVVANCTFSNNSAYWAGGGMYNYYIWEATITNCIFSRNSAYWFGGGMYNYSADPTITNCIFSGNLANEYSGGMHNDYSSFPEITNCIFSGNSAGQGGGIINMNDSQPVITNCIMWDDHPIEIDGVPPATVTYSDIEGGYTGTGNIDADPLFVNVPDLWAFTFTIGSTTTIEVPYATTLYAVGDVIEIEDDGVARTVSSATGTTVTFDPALPSPSTAGMLVENWGPGATDLDEDFHLSQTAAGQGSNSPCVNTGSDTAANLGMDDKTTRTDGVPDIGIVDMGYHYEP